MPQILCEWGAQGVRTLSPQADVTIIVDVLSFSTCVDIGVGRGISIFPYSGPLDEAAAFATSHGAVLARHRGQDQGHFSLSPTGFATNAFVPRVVLPSPNGSTLTLLAAETSRVLCGCLRNAAAVAATCAGYDTIAVIPAGERWPDGSLRPALEDWLGAGAIISHLAGTPTPEATAAAAAFAAHRDNLLPALNACPSGQELIDRGYPTDVELAAECNVSTTVPRFVPPAYAA